MLKGTAMIKIKLSSLTIKIILLTPTVAFLNTLQAAEDYNITDIGIIGPASIGGSVYAIDYSRATAINNSGTVAGNGYHPVNLGSSTSYYSTPWGYNHAISYTSGTLTDLGVPEAPTGNYAYTDTYANGMNDSGWIVGNTSSQNTNSGPFQAFISIDGITTGLGTFAGSSSAASDINNNNQIVGGVGSASGISRGYIYDYDTGNIDYLGTLGGDNSSATGINEVGQVIGQSQISSGQYTAFFYDNNIMTSLGTLEGAGASIANGLNDNGMVVGKSATVFSGTHGYVWTSNAGMVDLGTFGGDYSDANDVNNSGQIVGTASYTGNSGYGAFLYENGLMTDLNTLLAVDTGWTLTSATGINELGQIVGTGLTADGDQHAFLLTPSAVPIPASIWLFGSGLVGLISLSRRKNSKQPDMC